MGNSKNKIKLISLGLIVIGLISLSLERLFYGGIDASGVLTESLFLPIGMLSLLLGITLSLLLFFRNLLNILLIPLRKNRNHP